MKKFELCKFSDLEDSFATEFQSKMNDLITPNQLPNAEDVFGAPDDSDVPF